MRATIDSAGRLVIPPQLRERLGLVPGEVDVEADGVDLRVRPVSGDTSIEDGGWLLVPPSGTSLTDDVQRQRDADRR